ncbi:glycosyltransferase family 87 protein [Nocardioides montaniterrae]
MTREDWRRLARTSGFLTLWLLTGLFAVTVIASYLHRDWMGANAHAYWLAGRSSSPYQLAAPGEPDAFEYSPVFLQLVRPLTHLPFTVFAVGWSAVEALIFWWMTRGLGWRWRVPVLLMCVPELALGNINAVLGAVVVLGFRRPECWVFPALTKITPAGVGAVWFLARGEWRALVRMAVALVAVVAVSYLLDPGLWRDWFTYLTSHSTDHLPRGQWHLANQRLDIGIRLGIAVVLAAFFARKDVRWPLPLVMVLAVPVFGWTANQLLAMVPPMVRIWHDQRNASEADGSS